MIEGGLGGRWAVLRVLRAEHALHQRDKPGALVPAERADTPSRLFQPAKRLGGVALQWSPWALDLLDDLLERAAERRGQLLRGQRRRGALVDQPARGGLQRRRRRTCGLRNIGVHQRAQGIRGVTKRNRLEQEEEARLPLGEPGHRRQQQRDIEFVLTLHGGGRVSAR